MTKATGWVQPFFWILLLGLGLRLWALLSLQPCDDIYRYLWEGSLVVHGGDPWTTPPSHFFSISHDPLLTRVNHPEIPAIYPGVLIGLFALLRAVGIGILGFRLFLIAVELACALGVRALARREASNSGLWAFGIFWLCPLAIFEGAGRGHFEPLLELALVAWAAASGSRKSLVAGSLLGLAIQIKTVGGVVLGVVEGLRRPRRFPQILAGLSLVALLVGLVFPTSLVGMWKTGMRFGMEFESNDLIPHGLHGLGFGWGFCRILSAGILFLLLWGISRTRGDLYERSGQALFWTLACLPTFHAWYALWLLPFVALRPKAWLVVFLFSSLGYEAALWRSGGWTEFGWVRWVVWGPPLGMYFGTLCWSMRFCLPWMKNKRLSRS